MLASWNISYVIYLISFCMMTLLTLPATANDTLTYSIQKSSYSTDDRRIINPLMFSSIIKSKNSPTLSKDYDENMALDSFSFNLSSILYYEVDTSLFDFTCNIIAHSNIAIDSMEFIVEVSKEDFFEYKATFGALTDCAFEYDMPVRLEDDDDTLFTIPMEVVYSKNTLLLKPLLTYQLVYENKKDKETIELYLSQYYTQVLLSGIQASTNSTERPMRFLLSEPFFICGQWISLENLDIINETIDVIVHDNSTMIFGYKEGYFINRAELTRSIEKQGVDINVADSSYILFNFWGKWCQPSLIHQDEINSIALDVKSSNVISVIGVVLMSPSDTELDLRSYIKETRLCYPQVYESYQMRNSYSLVDVLHVVSFPTYLLVSPENRIIYRGGEWKELKSVIEDQVYK